MSSSRPSLPHISSWLRRTAAAATCLLFASLVHADLVPLPTVVITTPPDGTVITETTCENTVSVQLSFTGASNHAEVNLATLTATLDGNPITAVVTGLGTPNAAGTATLLITGSGAHVVAARVTNTYDLDATATSTFTVNILTPPPPIVTITTPADGDAFTYQAGDPPLVVPLSAAASAATGTVETLTATLDGAPLPLVLAGLGSASATGGADLSFTAAGVHTVVVTAANACGVSATASATFTVNVVIPPPINPPVVTIATPPDGSATVTCLPADFAFTFTAVSSGDNPGPITSVTVDLDGSPVTPSSLSGLGTTSVTGSGTLNVLTPGSHALTVTATNAGGSATDVNMFTVTPPLPAVTIETPAPGTSFTSNCGAPVNVPLKFVGTTTCGSIESLTATLDGTPLTVTTSGLHTTTATGTATLPFTSADSHTILVSATDAYGQVATAETNFTITVKSPTPTVTIITPCENAVFNLCYGSLQTSVLYSFKAASNNGFVVDSVRAELNGEALPAPLSIGLGTASVLSGGKLSNLPAGTYALTVYATSACATASDTVHFTVKGSPLPPSCVITTPPNCESYCIGSACGSSVKIPLAFTATSNVSGGVITKVTAKLDGTPVAVTATLNTKVVNATATLVVSKVGSHTITVSATDAVGTATDTHTFKVVVCEPKKVCGSAFFDVDFDGVLDCGEFGLGGVSVQLISPPHQVIATVKTDSKGAYCFGAVVRGSYLVVATAPTGLGSTTVSERSITVGSENITVPAFGFGLKFAAMRSLAANGKTIGFWKTNLDKAVSGKTWGMQVSTTKLSSYTKQIAELALSPFDNLSMKTAASLLGSTKSGAADLLSKQLLASEYNYCHGAYLGGDKNLTLLFVWWGEYVVKNPTKYSSSYILWAKDWFDAYNNSDGHAVNGPLP